MRIKTLRPLALAAVLGLAFVTPAAVAAPFDRIESQATEPLSSFQKVYIAPVSVELADPRTRRNVRDIDRDRPVSDADKARRAQDVYEDITRAFGKKFQLVDAPGADVLTVEAIVTKLTSTRPTIADAENALQLSFVSIYAGGADFDVRLSQGDTLLAEISDSRQTNLNDGRPRVGIWQDYHWVSKIFANKLARYVHEN